MFNLTYKVKTANSKFKLKMKGKKLLIFILTLYFIIKELLK